MTILGRSRFSSRLACSVSLDALSFCDLAGIYRAMANRKVKSALKGRAAQGYRVVTLREAAELTGTEFVVVEPRLQPKPARRRAIAAAVAAVLAERREKEQAAFG